MCDMTPMIKEIETKGVITKTDIPVCDYAVNPYVGCTHACQYCYASFMKRFTGHEEIRSRYLKLYLSKRRIANLGELRTEVQKTSISLPQQGKSDIDEQNFGIIACSGVTRRVTKIFKLKTINRLTNKMHHNSN